MSTYSLTVAIPTYNRPAQLEHTLSAILPQVLAHEDVQLLVLDNCSPIPAYDVLRKVSCEANLPDRVRVIRHSYNIGGDANILRCFEVAEGDFLWCLGDDDDPQPQAVDIIIADIKCDNFCYAYYGLSPEFPILNDTSDGRYIGTSIIEWARRTPDYGKRLFISESIFKLVDVRPYLHIAYRAATAGAGHLTMAFLAVLDGGRYLLSSPQIAAYQPPVAGTGYNCVPFAYGSVYLLSLVGTKCGRSEFDSFYLRGFSGWVMPTLLLRQALELHQGDSRYVRVGFGLIVDLFKPPFLHSPRLWFKWTICEMLAKVPVLASSLFSGIAKLRGRAYCNGEKA